MKSISTLVAGTLLLATLPAAAPADDPLPGCPDVRATPLDARLVWAGEVRRCGFGISIFGIGGGIFGPRCPEKRFLYPAHQECLGEPHAGTRCVPGPNLDVGVEGCECEEATILGTGLLIPSCECTSEGTAGHVQDATTELCEEA